MSLWTDWGDNWYKNYKKEQEYLKRLDQAEAEMGTEALTLANKYEQLESLTPNEDPSFIAAAADMGLTDQQYIALHQQTKNPSVRNEFNRSSDVNNQVKKHYNYNQAIVQKLTGNVFGGLYEGIKPATIGVSNIADKVLSYFFNGSRIFFESVIQKADSIGREWSTEYLAELENQLSSEGKRLEDVIEIAGYEDLKGQDIPFIPSIKARAIASYRWLQGQPDRQDYKNGNYNYDPSTTAKQFLIARGLTDKNGQPLMQETYLDKALELTADLTAEYIEAKEKEEGRELNFAEKASLQLKAWDDILDPEQKQDGEFWKEYSGFDSITDVSRAYFDNAIPTTLGDGIAFGLTGNLSSSYGPANAVLEIIDSSYSQLEEEAEKLLATGEISSTQYYDLIGQAQIDRDNAVQSLNYKKEYSMAGFIAGTVNVAKYVYLDLLNYILPGSGLAKRAGNNIDEVLTSFPQKIKKELDEGKTLRQIYDENSEVFQNMADILVLAKENDKPIAVQLINQGLHPDFAFKIQAADTNANDIIKIFEDGIENGYITDLFYGGTFIGTGKNKYLQSKTLNENLLEAIKDKPVDNDIVSTLKRGGGVRDQLLARDVKLPNLDAPTLDNVQESVTYFTRWGYLGKVPEARLNELTTEFYNALKEGNRLEAIEIFNNKLIRGEVGLQLKNLYGMSNKEIENFLNQFFLKYEKYGFNDNVAKPMSPSRNPDFYGVEDVDILTEKMFTDVVSESDIINLHRQSVELLSQLKEYTIQGPDIIQMIKATSQKRRLRAKFLNKEGMEDVFEIVRKAADEGIEINFWEEGSDLNKLIGDIKADFPEPTALFKYPEILFDKLDNFTFGIMKNLSYPKMLLLRLSYPLKLAIDGTIKQKLFGLRNLIDNPVGYFQLMLNDPDGMLAKLFGVAPDTLLTGPYRTSKEIKKLDKVLPPSVRKALGILSPDTQQYGTPEISKLFSTDVRFFDDRYITGTHHVGITKLSPQWEDAYVYFLYKYIDDDMAVAIAAMKKQGMSAEQVADKIQSTPALAKIVDEANQLIQKRGPATRNQTAAIIKSKEDFVRLAQDHFKSLDSYTGGKPEILDIIATGTVKNYNLRNVESLTAEISEKANTILKKIAADNKDILPTEIPYPSYKVTEASLSVAQKTKNTYGKYRNLLDSMFAATAQGEGSLIRIPVIKQFYNHFIEAVTVFGTRDALEQMLKAHLDPDIPISLNKKVLESVKKEIKRADHTLAEYDEVLSKYIKPKVTQNTYKGVTNFIATIFTDQGQKSVNYLSNTGRNVDSIKFTTDLQEAESLVYGASDKIAQGRLGFDDSKVGTYVANFVKNEIIYNGQLADRKLFTEVLANVLDTGYTPKDVKLLVDEVVEYLGKEGVTKNGIEDLLGINNREINLKDILIKFQNTVRTKIKDGMYTNEPSFDVGKSTIEKILKTKITMRGSKSAFNANIDNLVDDAYEYITANYKEGFSMDLLEPDTWSKVPGLYVSPYKTRNLVRSGDTVISKEQLKTYIVENQDLLRREGHYLGGWFNQKNGKFYLDISVRINRGVKDTTVLASKDAYSRVKFLGLAGDQEAFAELYLVKNADGTLSTKVVTEDLINNAAAYNWLRTQGSKLLTETQQKIFGSKPIVKAAGYLDQASGKDVPIKAFNANQIFEKMNIKAIFNRKEKSLEIFNPSKNPIMQNLNEWSYTQVLDMNDVRANIRRNMSFEDIHQRGIEYAMEGMTNLLYNITERGYFAQAYRVFFAFFEAWREYYGRYALLSANNPKAAYQIATGVRKGLENKIIVKDRFGDYQVFIPTEGTPLEVLSKADGQGIFTEDASVEESRVYIKRSFPLGALGVGGGGYLPSLGLGFTIPLGVIFKDKLPAKRLIEKTLLGGYPLQSIIDEPNQFFIQNAVPTPFQKVLNMVADEIGNTTGTDEDMYIFATTRGLQIAGQLHPEYAGDLEKIQKIGALVRDNIFMLQAWDRFVSPFAPKLNILYQIEGNQANFEEWYGTEGQDTGIVFNSMVELSVIHGFYQDMRKQWVTILGPQAGEYYALVEVVRLLGLDKYDLQTQFTSAGMQIKGKTISQAGRVARTTKEYDFVTENADLMPEFGPVLVYFSSNLDEGVIDYSGFEAIKGLGLVTPKTGEQFLLDTQTYLASIIGRAIKDERVTVLEATGRANPDTIKAENAKVDSVLSKMFPAAYGNSEAYNPVLGGQTAERTPNDIMIDYLLRASQDERFQDFELTPYLQEYFSYRQAAINAAKKAGPYPDDKSALNYIISSKDVGANEIRLDLYTRAYQIIDKYPLFMVVFDEILINEIDRFGFGVED